MKTVSPGVFLGIEEFALKNSDSHCNLFEHTAICKSAVCKVFYFDKKEWYDQLKSLKWMDYLIQWAKQDRTRGLKFDKKVSQVSREFEAIQKPKYTKRSTKNKIQ